METVKIRENEKNYGHKNFLCFKPIAKGKYVFIAFILLLIANIAMTSCNDGHSLDYIYGDYGVIDKTDESYTIRTDRGATLFPSASNISSSYLKDKDRVIVSFTILEDADTSSYFDYYVKVNDIYKILTKDILDYSPVISDSLGNDPVIINDLWIRNGFINVDFFFGGGQPNLKHMVNLAKHPELTDDDRILLEFRHNAFEDPYNYKYWSVVSFPTEGIDENPQDSVKLRILYQGFEKKETYDLTWYPHESTSAPRHLLPAKETGIEKREIR